jgi:hypothetical protein
MWAMTLIGSVCLLRNDGLGGRTRKFLHPRFALMRPISPVQASDIRGYFAIVIQEICWFGVKAHI